MIVLKIAGGILLVLVILAALCALLLTPRVGISVHAQNGRVTGAVRYGVLRWKLHGPRGRPAAREKQPPGEGPRTPGKTPRWPAELARLDLGGIVCEGLAFLDDVKDRLRIEQLRLSLVLAAGDAAETGLMLGGLSAVAGMVYPFLVRSFTINTLEIVLDGDFHGNTTRYDLHLSCSARPIRLLAAAAVHGLRLYRLIRQTQPMEANAI